MVNVGEIAIFRRTGLQPVFFGETLVGTKLPNLTYMLVFDDMAAHDKNWAKFIGDPEWNRLSTTPCYTNAEILTTSPAYSCGQRGIRRFDWSADCLVRAFWAVAALIFCGLEFTCELFGFNNVRVAKHPLGNRVTLFRFRPGVVE